MAQIREKIMKEKSFRREEGEGVDMLPGSSIRGGGGEWAIAVVMLLVWSATFGLRPSILEVFFRTS